MATARKDSRKLEPVKNNPGMYRRHNDGCSRKRCDCPYVVRWKHAGKGHKQLFARFEDAREFKAQLGSRTGSRRPQSSETLAKYYERWKGFYRGRTKRGLEDNTMSGYEISFRVWVLKLPIAGMKMRDVYTSDIRDAFHEMERRGASPETITRAKRALSVLFATALEDREVSFNPVAGAAYVPTKEALERHAKPKPKDMTETLLKATLNAMTEQWQAFFMLQAQTGIRIGELFGLRWKNVHLGDDAHIVVAEQIYRGEVKRTKTDKFAPPESVPLSGTMASWLAELRPENAKPDALVFPTRTGGPQSYGNVRKRVLLPALGAAGVARIDGTTKDGEPIYKLDGRATHHFRHACASILPKHGKTREQMKAWLRHKHATTTDRYMHLTDDGLGSADVWDEIVGDSWGPRGAPVGPPNPRETVPAPGAQDAA
jgi:integrase